MITPDPQLAVEYGLFTVAQALSAGIRRPEIERGVRRGRWDRPARGVLRAAGREPRAGDDLLMAVLRAGPGAVAGFESAAEVHGWDLLKPPAKPQLIVPEHSHLPNGSVGYRMALSPANVMLVGVLPMTTPGQTALNVASTAPLDAAVITIDSALRSRTVSLVELRARFLAARCQGVRRARAALDLADPLSGSLPESQARLLLWQGGVPAPISQFPVFVNGVYVVRTDFAWPGARVALEVDGFVYHSAFGAFQSDRDKQNALVRAGWRVIRVTVADIRSRPAYVVALILEALDSTPDFANHYRSA